MITKKNEIISIFNNNIGIGFICRRSVVYGCAQGIPDGWVCTYSLGKDIEWYDQFATRKEAIEWLIKQS